MELGLSTLLFPNSSPVDGVKIASDLNLDYVEIILDMPHFPINQYEDKISELKSTIKNLDLKVRIHGRFWDLNPISQYPQIREIALNRTLESIEVCEELNGDVVTIHPGRCWFRENQELFREYKENYHEYIREIEEKAREKGIMIGVETGAQEIDLPHGTEEYNEILDKFKNVGITLDVGHAFIATQTGEENNPEKGVVELIEELNGGLINVHLHDNFGQNDQHLPLKEGKINFNTILKALDKHYGGPIILELWKPSKPKISAEKSVEQLKGELNKL
ncbi:MAG: sugar phosphate isomerase/epimerase [Hadesarchaea archaeon]|nr:sugar phosphate isomerase/epimerase [Hadesarchaea archaeon]